MAVFGVFVVGRLGFLRVALCVWRFWAWRVGRRCGLGRWGSCVFYAVFSGFCLLASVLFCLVVVLVHDGYA